MADFPLVIDVAKFQDDSLEFFKNMKSKGVQGVIIQLTAGSKGHPYSQNPKAANQINNARAAGLRVHAYHYSYAFGHDDMLTEADNFITQFKALGLDPDNDYAYLDEEDNKYNPSPATNDCNTWLQAVKNAGIKHTGTYSMASWFENGRINVSGLKNSDSLWVANYGVSEPGVDNTDVWQFTDNCFGVDASYDFFNELTKGVNNTNVVPAKLPATPVKKWNPITYTIQTGDTLTAISLKTKDSIATIVANNDDVFHGNMNTTIYPGQKLLVNDHEVDFGRLIEKRYIVQSGDSLYAIAKYLGDRPDTVVANNPQVFHGNMYSTIYPGQTILFYR